MIKKRILIITDSVGLPREKPQLCTYEETWPFLLRDSGHTIYQLSLGGATIDELIRQLEYLFVFSPDLIIVQSGIVDCAPRSLGKLESLFLNHFKISRKLLHYILPRCNSFLRKNRGVVYTPKDKFKKSIDKLSNRFPGIEVYWIGILPASDGYEKIVPGITRSINSYNQILKKSLEDRYIDMSAIPLDGVMTDHIHLNGAGHKYVFDLMCSKLISKE